MNGKFLKVSHYSVSFHKLTRSNSQSAAQVSVTDRIERSLHSFEGYTTRMGQVDHVLNSKGFFSGQYPYFKSNQIVVFINEADPHITYFSAEFDSQSLKSVDSAWAMFYDQPGQFQNLECWLQIP